MVNTHMFTRSWCMVLISMSTLHGLKWLSVQNIPAMHGSAELFVMISFLSVHLSCSIVTPLTTKREQDKRTTIHFSFHCDTWKLFHFTITVQLKNMSRSDNWLLSFPLNRQLQLCSLQTVSLINKVFSFCEECLDEDLPSFLQSILYSKRPHAKQSISVTISYANPPTHTHTHTYTYTPV